MQPKEVDPNIYLDRSGLPELVVQSMGLGTQIGLSLTSFFDDPARVASGAVLGAGLGFGLPLLLNHNKPVHVTQAGIYNFGARLGLINGTLIPMLWNENDSKVTATMPGILGLAGLGAGILLYPHSNLTPGQISALSSGLGFGVVSGVLGLMMFNISLDSLPSVATAGLLFANGGVLGAYLARDIFDIDRSRVIMIDFGGIMGAAVGAGFGFLLGGDDAPQQLMAGSVLAGIYTGLITAYILTDGHDHFRRSASNEGVAEDTVGSLKLKTPTPTVVSSIDPNTGKNIVGFGVNFLSGSW